ncbi:MAG: hypothetical protein JW776_04980 [Candidatus Lokiarchaeota archaeon]|nr:hypothetical protein [Candidatus Lokiarchaeota archaeon]
MNEKITESPEKPDTYKRIISIDLARGISIFLLIILHTLIYGVWYSEGLALDVVHIAVVAALSPLVMLATWGGGFSYISGIVNVYNMKRRVERGIKYRKTTIPLIVSGIALLLFDPLRSVILYRTTDNVFSPIGSIYIPLEPSGVNRSIWGNLIETGRLAFADPEKLYAIGSLPAIAISGFVIAIIFAFLFYKGGYKKVKRNVIVLLVLGFLFAGIANPISDYVIIELNLVERLYVQGGWKYFLGYILKWFFGGQLSYFPMGSYAFFGALAGYLLALKVDYKFFKKIFLTIILVFLGGFLITAGLLFLNSDDILAALFDYEVLPRVWLYFSLFAMSLLLLICVRYVEYASEEKRENFLRKTKFFRKMGNVTLTLYLLEGPINLAIATGFHYLFSEPGTVGWGMVDSFMVTWWQIVIFMVVSLAFWLTVIWAWSKINFKYGFEYWVMKFGNLFRTEKSIRMIGDQPSSAM